MASLSHRAPLAPSSASQVLVAMPDFDLEKCLARLDPKERAKYDSEEFKKTAEAAFDQADVTQSARRVLPGAGGRRHRRGGGGPADARAAASRRI